MKTLLKLAGITLLFMSCGWVSIAQTAFIYPATASAPRGSYQTVTAVINGTNNKTVTWSTDFGTIVGTNPCAAKEPCTIAVYSASAGTAHLTATSNANGAVTASATITFTASPTIATGHPRLIFNASQITGLRAKATAGNPMWQAIKNSAQSSYTTVSGSWSLTCLGGTGLPPNSLMAAVTHITISGNVLTVTASNGFSAGTQIRLAGLTTNTFLNGQSVNLSSASGTQFTAPFTHADVSTSDIGTATNYVSFTENLVWNLSLAANFAPTSTERDQYGCAAHDVWIQVMKWTLDGNIPLQQGNEWAETPASYVFAYANDWLIGTYLTSTADLNLARQYAANLEFLSINNIYNGTLAPIGTYNDPFQFQESNENSMTGMRAMGNNYTQARIMLMTAGALTFDDTTGDDPPLSNTCSATRYQVCPDGTAGSLHAYWRYVAGGMLYKDWANLEDPNVVQQAYNTAFAGTMPTQPMCNTLWHSTIPCLGNGRGGEASEGTSYGNSVGKLAYAALSMHTAGYDDPLLWGPQISFATSSYWPLRNVADLSDLLGLSGLPSEQSRWNFLTDGDTLQYWTSPASYLGDAQQMALHPENLNALEWVTLNTAFGMAGGTVGGCTTSCGYVTELGNDYASQTALDSFLSLPAANPVTSSPPTDPRPSMPKDMFFAGNNHIVARDNWTTGSNTVFSYHCTNTLIDHEHEYCGRDEIYSKGEWITKGRNEFNNYINSESAAPSQNIAAIINTPTGPDCGYFVDACVLGGQFWHGYQAGLDTLYHSELPGYVAAVADSANTYNGGWGGFGSYNGVTKAGRSLIYLRGVNEVISYDRAESTGAWSKATNLNTTGNPTITGNQAVWLTRSGTQKAAWTSVIGGNPVLDTVYSDSESANDWEIYGRLKVNAGTPTTARFLDVLEWGASGFTPTSPSAIASTAGQAFDGALTAGETTAVMFMRNWPATFTGTTYPALGATTHYVSDLTPNTTYTISGTGTPGTATTDNAGVMTFSATGTGNIVISTGGTPTVATPTSSPTPGTYTTTQSVTLADTTGGATICFTTTGATPTATTAGTCDSSPTQTYSGAISVPTTTTIKAIGTLAGSMNSSVLTATYTINPPAATPTFSPVAGTYSSTQTVTISTTTSSPTIYYTTDGSTPTTGSTVYSAPISVATSQTVKAIATASGFSTSAVGSAAYIINLPAPTPQVSISGTVQFSNGATQ